MCGIANSESLIGQVALVVIILTTKLVPTDSFNSLQLDLIGYSCMLPLSILSSNGEHWHDALTYNMMTS